MSIDTKKTVETRCHQYRHAEMLLREAIVYHVIESNFSETELSTFLRAERYVPIQDLMRWYKEELSLREKVVE